MAGFRRLDCSTYDRMIVFVCTLSVADPRFARTEDPQIVCTLSVADPRFARTEDPQMVCTSSVADPVLVSCYL